MSTNGFDEDALAEAYNRGLELEKAGRNEEAAVCYRQALKLDPADHGGAAVRLAAMGLGEVPDKAPDAYVMTLFDQHAEVFDSVLVDQLGYSVPAMLAELLPALLPEGVQRLLDLGCGTGLVGEALYEMVDHATGVDLAEKMIELADEREAYDELYVAEVVHFLEENEELAFDLIVAADVLPYMGRLESFFAGVAKNASAGALTAFSSETLPGAVLGGRDFMVGPNQRFAHALDYIDRLLVENGFERLIAEPITVRREQDQPVPGHLVVARKL
ncbi:methyltransferase [Pararhizobium haloflavum]|uniref:methyltransferase n=1 Tax=Pararhizobium haloflavum TaxID=2037914 RepID=UPI000C17592F|nr:methyltransferase [Pararhizobium haloflavum]